LDEEDGMSKTHSQMVMSFTEQQCCIIMKPLLDAGSSKAGVVHTYHMHWFMAHFGTQA